MALILIQKDPANRIAKDVTTEQRTTWMQSFAIYDVNADGSLSGPFGPTGVVPKAPSAASLGVLTAQQVAAGATGMAAVTPAGGVLGVDGSPVSGGGNLVTRTFGGKRHHPQRHDGFICT